MSLQNVSAKVSFGFFRNLRTLPPTFLFLPYSFVKEPTHKRVKQEPDRTAHSPSSQTRGPEPQNRTGEARLMIAFVSAVNSFFQSRPTFQAFATRPKFSSLFRPLRQNKKPVSHPTSETKHPVASGATAVVVALYRPHPTKLSTPLLKVFSKNFHTAFASSSHSLLYRKCAYKERCGVTLGTLI